MIFRFLLLLSLVGCASKGLKSTKEAGFMFLKSKVPYANYVDYYGYVSPKTRADGKYKKKDTYYLYVWVPGVIDELGVSMYSPADKKPKSIDFKHKSFDKNFAKNNKDFFDTYLVLEKLKIKSAATIKNGGRALSLLKTNDDSREMPKNPSGRSYNSLLRHVSKASNPLKALTRGVYRIGFTSFRGSVKGSYIATIGTNIPGIKMAANLKSLHDLVNK